MTFTDTRIDLPFIDCTKRRYIRSKECYLILFEKHIEYKISATYERLDNDTDMWLSTLANFRFTRKRDSISDVSMFYDNEEKGYSLSLEFNGIGSPMEWLFETPKECLSTYNKIRQYFIESLT